MRSDTCELCAAARFTEWFYEDDECWIAECESCSVPMVVWRVHDPDPPDDVRARLWQRLDQVADTLAERSADRSTGRGGAPGTEPERDREDVPGGDPGGQRERPRDHYIDDNLRSIPGHYHAHARPRRGWFGSTR